MYWKIPPRIKVYEALGSIADKRVTLINTTQAQVKSSSGNKVYKILYDSITNTISCNDNASYWQGYLGYPALAFLMQKGMLPFDQRLSEKLKGIPWKKINQQNKNDFKKTEDYIFTLVNQKELEIYAKEVIARLLILRLNKPQKLTKPPIGW